MTQKMMLLIHGIQEFLLKKNKQENPVNVIIGDYENQNAPKNYGMDIIKIKNIVPPIENIKEENIKIHEDKKNY